MSDILASLTSPGASNPSAVGMPASPAATGGVPQSPDGAESGTDTESVISEYPFVGLVLKGDLPGFSIPKGFSSPAGQNLKPEALLEMGLGFYRPQDQSIAVTVFNPGVISEENLKKIDAEGKLPESLPSIADLLSAGGESPLEGLAQGEQPGNGESPEPPPQNMPVPVRPRPSAPGGQHAAMPPKPQQPSARQIPGAGNVLNSLIKKVMV